jgi:hypothetical protein
MRTPVQAAAAQVRSIRRPRGETQNCCPKQSTLCFVLGMTVNIPNQPPTSPAGRPLKVHTLRGGRSVNFRSNRSRPPGEGAWHASLTGFRRNAPSAWWKVGTAHLTAHREAIHAEGFAELPRCARHDGRGSAAIISRECTRGPGLHAGSADPLFTGPPPCRPLRGQHRH